MEFNVRPRTRQFITSDVNIVTIIHLSNEMATSVLTDALTATPCRNGVSLHINAPNCHPVNNKKQRRQCDMKIRNTNPQKNKDVYSTLAIRLQLYASHCGRRTRQIVCPFNGSSPISKCIRFIRHTGHVTGYTARCPTAQSRHSPRPVTSLEDREWQIVTKTSLSESAAAKCRYYWRNAPARGRHHSGAVSKI